MCNPAILLGTALLAFAPFPTHTAARAQSKPVFAEPALSPDGREIAFVSGGDIWTVPTVGGEARLLVSHPASESRPIYSPDGTRLAFVSNRTGNGDIYVLTLATGDVRRLTFDDVAETVDGWSRDGLYVYLSTTSRDIAGMNDVLRVRASGGTPMLVSADRYASEYWAAPSPSEPGTLAITARGIVAGQWWRNGHSHIDESEIWLVRDGTPPGYERVAGGDAKYAWPMWSGDGRTLYYMSDKSGAENIYAKPMGGAERALTSFRDGRVLWPGIAANGGVIVFERGFAVWRLDPASGRVAEVPISLRGAPAASGGERVNATNGFQWFALAPDGKKVAFATRGEIFATSARENGEATRITFDPGNDGEIHWAPDSRRIVFSSDRGGSTRLHTYDFTTGAESPLTTAGDGPDNTPIWSPDERSVAFIRGGRELRVVDVATKRERLIASGHFDREPFPSWRGFAWSPDSRWLAYSGGGAKGFSNVFIAPAAGGESRAVSFLPNVFGNGVSWSPDGTFLLLDSRQRTESGIVARVDLVPRTPRFREDRFRELFDTPARPTPAAAPARQPGAAREAAASDTAASARPGVTPVFDGIRQRLTVLPTGLDVNYAAISPDGKWVLLSASAAGQTNLHVYSLDELAVEDAVARQITSTSGNKTFPQWTSDSKEVFYLEGGRINSVTVETRAVRALNTSAQLDVDFHAEKELVFRQAWNYLNDNFYDPAFHGVDWRASRERYAPFVAGSRSGEDLRRVLSLMIGDLNASHMGVTGRSFSPQTVTGRLGVRFSRAVHERDGRFQVTEVVPLSPAAIAGIEPSDVLVAIDGEALAAATNIDELLQHKIDRRVTVSVTRPGGARAPREVAVRPINTATEKRLLYRAWVDEKRAYVDRVSQGRLGYVHMPDMGAGSLTQLYLDLDPDMHAKEGVVVDIRNNNGGFVNAYALDVFARQGYLRMQPRGWSAAAPARTLLGQRALESPTVLVVNQHSLSDAEDFTEGYRAMQLGKVVGEPTSGWIIYTSNTTLMDGTSLRIPSTRITDSRGEDMELRPRPVDVAVERPIGESYVDRDSQLDAAVRVLLEQIRR
ncbi:MAG: S41 family peptidase [Gemmatimonadaceae bacterium]